MISQCDSPGGGFDPGNVFEVRSHDGGKTIEWVIEGQSGPRKALKIHAELDRGAALNLFAWGVAIMGIDLDEFRRQVEKIRTS